MNFTRSRILQNIREALSSRKSMTVSALEARLAFPPIHEQPVIREESMIRFQQQLENVAATLTTVSTKIAIPHAVMEFLRQHELPFSVVMDTRLAALPWPADLTIAYRTATAKDRVSVSQAIIGVAETGSLVLQSGPQNPTTLNFLPEVQIILLSQERLVLHLEEIWSQLRKRDTGKQLLPRALNIVTGPSRTADIEQTIQLGAHGPKMLHVITYLSEL